MKNLFLLLVFSAFTLASAQDSQNKYSEAAEEAARLTDKEFAQAPNLVAVVDSELQQSLDHLSERADAHRVDYSALLQDAGLLSLTVVDSLPNDHIGLFEPAGTTFTVKIARFALEDPISLEWTLAHELGHGLGLKHQDKKMPDGSPAWSAEIMASEGVIDPSHLIYQIMNHPHYSIEIWDRYFTPLKSK